MFVPQWIIEKKRDGGVLTTEELHEWIQGVTDGSIPDYQVAAWAMAVYFRGMETQETACLTDAMMRSGELVDFAHLPGPTADKHSTGGIGDKISIPLAPLVASIGVYVPMISGRGLGITGGTLDKLEAISGFNTHFSIADFQRLTFENGTCMIGQTDTLAPADKRLYALRDVTGTVPSIPLITASIMSKKLAEGAQALVFDVKCGSGAFMQTYAEAEELAKSLLATGRALGRNCAALITNMDEPLGRTIGNALEIEESIEILRGEGPKDVRELTLLLASRMAVLSGMYPSDEEAQVALEASISSGKALRVFKQMVQAQGGDVSMIDHPERLPQARYTLDILAKENGFIASVNAQAIGRIALQLGAGRLAVTDSIDYGAGIKNLKQRGEAIQIGEALLTLCGNDEERLKQLEQSVRDAITICASPVEPKQLLFAEL